MKPLRYPVHLSHVALVLVAVGLAAGIGRTSVAAAPASLWTIVPSPSVGSISELIAVSADSPCDARVVGNSFSSQTGRTRNPIERWAAQRGEGCRARAPRRTTS